MLNDEEDAGTDICQLLDQLKLQFNDVATWKPEIIMSCISSKSGKVEEIDICSKMLHTATCNFFKGNSECNIKFDPAQYNGINSFDKLKSDIIVACRKSGFKATTDNRQYRKQKGSKLASLQIICDHNRSSQLPKGKNKIYNTTRPLCEEKRCAFEFNVFCSEDDGFWYISNTDPTKVCHNFHIQHSQEFIESKINLLSPDLLSFAETCFSLGLPTSVISHLCKAYSQNQSEFTDNQLRYKIMKERDKEIVKDLSQYKNLSSAEALINDFENCKEEVYYCELIHSKKDGHLKITQSKGRPPKILHLSTEQQKSIDEIRKDMEINDGQDVLLAFAWVTAEELELVQRFPELQLFDVTMKTNSENRGLFLATGIDGLGKIFTGLHCFMPNSKASSYNWIYTEALVTLWGETTLRNVQTIITDGEDALYKPLENLSEVNLYWKNVCVYRCTFHLFTQEWNSIPRGHLSNESKIILQKLKRWIDTWIFNLDREKHFLVSMEKFKSVLQSKECDEIRAPVLKIIESLEVSTAKWAKCYKKESFDLGHTTTSPGEASNSSLKRFCKGNMSSQSLSGSARTQRDHSKFIHKKRNYLVAKEIDKNSADNFMEEQNMFTQFLQDSVFDAKDRASEYVPMRIEKFK
ncbi:hypothetical protein CTEN210_18594 [Chaetoceros tenuissimus]|uniref:MULE transposase domain-containing protein n=1 Tax=Chaetoceros tenuissimus TaxID=426638 RepID=A0AAD3HGG1_9STRA|nr:hypothetical protein CTEN210_18594 [Chaetoceros tenuissimus]